MTAKPLPAQAVLRALFHYDERTGVFTWRRREGVKTEWNTSWAGKRAGSPDKDGYIQLRINGSLWKASRVAWVYVHGDGSLQPDQDMDHKDGVPGHDRIKNLRPASHLDNQANMSRHTDARWPKGVTKSAGCASWCARICRGGRLVHLGSFRTPEAAHAAYVKAARRLHKRFARTT